MILTKTQNGVEIPLNEEEILDYQQKETAHLARLEQLKLTQYKEDRQKEYPTVEEMVVALIEKIGENRPESFNTLMGRRMDIKAKYPKPV